MFLSVIYISNRPRSIDLLASGIVQDRHVPGWELVVVDGCPDRPQTGRVPEFLDSLKIPVGWYGPPRKRVFPWSVTGFANAMNTGLVNAAGEYVVFVHDYTVLPAGFVGQWLRVLGPDRLVHGGADVYTAPPPDHPDRLIHTWQTPPTCDFREHWTPAEFEVGYWGGPTAFFDTTNGIDPRADFCSEWSLSNVKYLAGHYGLSLAVDPAVRCIQIDHRAWHQGGENENTEYKTWGQLANVPEPPEWSPWSANDFCLRDIRRRV